MPEREPFTNEYLNSKLGQSQPESAKDIVEAQQTRFILEMLPITERVDYPKEGGSFEYENREFKISFSYEPWAQNKEFIDQWPRPHEKFPSFITSDPRSELQEEGIEYLLTDFKLVLRSNPEKILDLKDHLPNGYYVLFKPKRPNQSYFKDGGPTKTDLIDKTVIVSGDLTKFQTILGLWHELGHTHIKPDIDKFGLSATALQVKNQEKISEKQAELFLRAERDAFAYALWYLRPFLKKESVDTKEFSDQLITFIHQRILDEAINADFDTRPTFQQARMATHGGLFIYEKALEELIGPSVIVPKELVSELEEWLEELMSSDKAEDERTTPSISNLKEKMRNFVEALVNRIIGVPRPKKK